MLSNFIYMLQITHQIYISSPNFSPKLEIHCQLLLVIFTWKFIRYLKLNVSPSELKIVLSVLLFPNFPVSVCMKHRITQAKKPRHQPWFLIFPSFPHKLKYKSFLPYFINIEPQSFPCAPHLLIYHFCPSHHNVSFEYSYLEKAMAAHFSTLAWEIPWIEKPDRL